MNSSTTSVTILGREYPLKLSANAMQQIKKLYGGLAKAGAFLVDCCVNAIDQSMPGEIIVVHAAAPDMARHAADLLAARFPDVHIQICGLSPVIGAHTGPGMMAVIHWGNRNYV